MRWRILQVIPRGRSPFRPMAHATGLFIKHAAKGNSLLSIGMVTATSVLIYEHRDHISLIRQASAAKLARPETDLCRKM